MPPFGGHRISEKLDSTIKFCHIDAAHDYGSVRESIELLLPRLVPGAVCSDTIISRRTRGVMTYVEARNVLCERLCRVGGRDTTPGIMCMCNN